MDELLRPFFDLQDWIALSEHGQNKSISRIRKLIRDDFEFVNARSYGDDPRLRVPIFREIESGIEFVLVIGGVLKMGVSAPEVDEMKAIGQELYYSSEVLPTPTVVRVNPFLISRFPALDSVTREYIEIDESLYRPEFSRDPDSKVPIHLTRRELRLLSKALGGFEIPSEAQWEYAYRAGTSSLFNFGSKLPSLSVLEDTILRTEFSDESANLRASNAFGLVGMNTGEWCADSFHRDGEIPKGDRPIDKGEPYTIRGGAATLWPWQSDSEWTYLISGARWNSQDIEDGVCGTRLSYRIFET